MRFGEILNGDSEDEPKNLEELVRELDSSERAALYGALGEAIQRLNAMPVTDPRPGPGDAIKAEIIEQHLEQEKEVGQ